MTLFDLSRGVVEIRKKKGERYKESTGKENVSRRDGERKGAEKWKWEEKWKGKEQ